MVDSHRTEPLLERSADALFWLSNPHGHLRRDKWTALSGLLSLLVSLLAGKDIQKKKRKKEFG